MSTQAFGVSAGGAATMGGVAISVEWLALNRHLSQIGALSLGLATPAIAGLAGSGSLTPPGLPTVMLRATPSGTVTPPKGPTSGIATKYGDTRNKHTKVADHTAAELDDAVKNPAKAPPDLQYLKPNVGNPGYGSQLSKEAADKYGDLVKDALENGTRVSATRIDHTAAFDVGIDIISGSLTKNYRMFYSNTYGGWHIFPVL